MKLSQPFVQLPFLFDYRRLQEEVSALENADWLPHPSGMPGNSALPLISRDAGNNDNFDGPMEATPHLMASPYIRQCLHSMGEVYGRSRLMSLEPGAEVHQHVDFNYHWYSRVRIHIPVITSPKVFFYCGDKGVNMEPGTCWIFDSWSHHRVANRGLEKRIHLVVDTAGSSQFWDAVEARIDGRMSIPELPLPFEPGLDRPVKTERYNSTPVISPGEMKALVDDLITDLYANRSNNRPLLRSLRTTLYNLVHDWRVLWSQYGYSHSGVRYYQRLLQQTIVNLPAKPRELTTGSNDVGAVSIVMQRIIRAALRPELIDDFLKERNL